MSPRLEETGPGWCERFVDPIKASETTSMACAVSQSLSYVVIPNFATAEERYTLRDSAMLFQEVFEKDGDEDVVRFKGIRIKWVTECSRFSVKELLSDQANSVSELLLNRLLQFLEFGQDNVSDKQLSELALKQFGIKRDLQQRSVQWYDEMTYDKVSNPEPMVNIYREGGFFKRHNDGMHLTLLVVLTDAVEGGGTAFYVNHQAQNDTTTEGPREEEEWTEGRRERPPEGTAMIWSGAMEHSALPVLKGLRAVYVGSFDLVQQESEEEGDDRPMF